MRIGLVIVGDEILSGRRTDTHLPSLVKMLKKRGLLLSWSRVIGDDWELLVDTYRQTFASSDLIFSTGGIGGTPDDMTRQAVACALGTVTERHPEGVKILEAYCQQFDRQLTPERYRLVEFPKGASLIPNPVNTIPGFSIDHHHFVPGFPQMAWPMMEWVLDNLYPQLANEQYLEEAVMVYGAHEGNMIPLMEEITRDFPQLKIFSLPIMHDDRPRVELGVKGNSAMVKQAMDVIKEGLVTLGACWERV